MKGEIGREDRWMADMRDDEQQTGCEFDCAARANLKLRICLRSGGRHYRAVFPVELEVGRQMLRELHGESKLYTFYFLGAILEAFVSQPPIRREKPPGMYNY